MHCVTASIDQDDEEYYLSRLLGTWTALWMNLQGDDVGLLDSIIVERSIVMRHCWRALKGSHDRL